MAPDERQRAQPREQQCRTAGLGNRIHLCGLEDGRDWVAKVVEHAVEGTGEVEEPGVHIGQSVRRWNHDFEFDQPKDKARSDRM